MKCGLLGRKLGHSYSPQIHRYLGDYKYTLIEREPDELDAFFAERDFDAINVTIPYKEDVMKYCAEIDEKALAVGSVNTIVNENGRLHGYNTDYFGFRATLTGLIDVRGKKVLILGSGGSSKTATAVIKDLGGTPVIISRRGENNYENISRHHADTALIVNTTPVGMFPENLQSPICLDDFSGVEAVIDIIYNPAKTKLLLDAERLGIKYRNGLYMLVAQAKQASEYFTKSRIDDSIIEAILRNIRRELINLVLVGMPGCGKSTLGAYVAKALGRRFVDMDDEVTRREGRTPAAIIRAEGEAAFRKCESRALSEVCKHSSLVIATGGGAVTVDENFNTIRQNAVVLWLMRDLSLLPTKNRPLSEGENSVYALYERRKDAYARFSDASLPNTGSVEKTAEAAISLFDSLL